MLPQPRPSSRGVGGVGQVRVRDSSLSPLFLPVGRRCSPHFINVPVGDPVFVSDQPTTMGGGSSASSICSVSSSGSSTSSASGGPAVVPVVPSWALTPPACAYSQHRCPRPCVEGRAYCLRHVLEDRTAPYRQCGFVYSGSGRRCLIPAPAAAAGSAQPVDKKEPHGLCAEHARRAQVARQKAARRRAPPLSSESLLLSLSHYAPKEMCDRVDPSGMEGDAADLSGAGDAEEEDIVTPALNPFVDMDAAKVNNETSKVLDYASESDSDLDVATFDSTWPGPDVDSSDADSVDGSLEETCKFSTFERAGVYTAEEVAQLTKDKLIRLQSLYIDQFRRLQQCLKVRRRRYLIDLKREKETLCSIHAQTKDSPHELKLYRKLQALGRYHRRCGMEAIMHKKSLERRASVTEGVTVRPPPSTKCIFTEGGVKCGERSLPLAKHCFKHILQDSHQVIFRACGCSKAGFPCQEPVAGVFEDAACVYHTNLPPPPPHLSVSHILAEAAAAKKLQEKAEEESQEQPSKQERLSPQPTTSGTSSGAPAADTSHVTVPTDRDPQESFQSETSTTDTASFEGSVENEMNMDD